MKRLNYFLCLTVLVVAAACQKPAELEPSLTILSSEVNFPDGGGVFELEFEASSAWTISLSEESSWLTVNPASGDAGSVKVLIEAEENGFDPRTATLTVSCGSKTSTVLVSQEGESVFNPETVVNLSSQKQVYELNVVANVEYEVEVSQDAADWITVLPEAKGEPVSKFVRLEIAANEGDERTGYITLACDNGSSTVKLVQEAGYVTMATLGVTYLGTRDFPYDLEAGMYPQFREYALALSTEDGTTEALLALNAVMLTDPLSTLPSGRYVQDLTGGHAVGTFSVKGLEDNGTYYTYVKVNGETVPIYEGEFTVSDSESGKSVVAALVDEAGKEYRFVYDGPLPEYFEDDSFAVMQFSADFYNTYNTYFETQANEWSVYFILSAPYTGASHHVSYIGLTLYGEAGDIAGDQLPVGDFVFDGEIEYGGTGYTKANPYTFTGGGNDINYTSVSFYQDESLEVTESGVAANSVRISRNDDGTYNFEFNAALEMTTNDIDYNTIVLDRFPFDAKLSNVKLDINTNNLKPCLDKDEEFTKCFMDKYDYLWFGQSFSTDGNAFVMSLGSLNDSYDSYIVLHTTAEYTFEKNASKPTYTMTSKIPSGTYTFSNTPGAFTLHNANFVTTPYSYVKNNYTGNKCIIVGGSVTITDGTITFNDLRVKNPEDGFIYVHRGTFNAKLATGRDFTKNSKRLKIVE